MRKPLFGAWTLAFALACSGTPGAPPTAPRSTDDSTTGPAQPSVTSPPLARPEPATLGPVPGTVTAGDQPASDVDEQPVSFTLQAAIPMRDGVQLSARLYRPVSTRERVPAIFVKTPYNASVYHAWGMYFARRGYAVALVDARGRGDSQGEFRAFETDGRDGYDVVEWLAAQPWCSGKVGMFGGSYDGFGQWATVKQRPPHLATVVPVAAVGPGVDFPMWNNISYPYAIRWLTYVSGRALQARIFADDSLFGAVYTDSATGVVRFRDLDVRVGNPSPTYRTWQQHPTLDGYWRSHVPEAAEWKNLEIPILTITGHYDDDQPGALNYYLGHMKHGTKRGRQRHYLVIGPWDHGGTRYPNPEIGGLRVGTSSVLDMKSLHHQWFEWTLKSGKKPEFLAKRVAYFVIGANQWRYADELGDATSGPLVLHLDSDGRADDVHHSGTLSREAPARDGGDSYKADPLDPRLNIVEIDTGMDVPVVNRKDGAPPSGASLVYHSAPFTEATEIVGGAVLDMSVTMNVPDTDFSVGLFEVRRDGQTVFLSNSVLRARDQRAAGKTDGVHLFRIDDFAYIAHRINAGSRLRLVISPPVGASWQRNFQSGGVVADETAADARVGTITVHHGPTHPSRLTLGVVRSSPK